MGCTVEESFCVYLIYRAKAKGLRQLPNLLAAASGRRSWPLLFNPSKNGGDEGCWGTVVIRQYSEQS